MNRNLKRRLTAGLIATGLTASILGVAAPAAQAADSSWGRPGVSKQVPVNTDR